MPPNQSTAAYRFAHCSVIFFNKIAVSWILETSLTPVIFEFEVNSSCRHSNESLNPLLSTTGHIIDLTFLIKAYHIKWVHCHHGMVRPRVADRGDGLQIWRVAANILNKQSRTADSGWSSSLGVGRGLTTLRRKTQYLLRITTHSLGTGRITWKRGM
jgi:hypothetical protein